MNYKRNIKVAVVYFVSLLISLILISCIIILCSGNKLFAKTQNITNYQEAQAYLDKVQEEYNQIMDKVQQTYDEVEQTTDQLLLVQASYVDKQNKFNNMIKHQYKNALQYSLTSFLVDSSSLSEFFKNLDFCNIMANYEYVQAKEKEKEKQKFNSILEQLNNKASLQNQYLSQAKDTINQAQNTVEQMKNKLTKSEIAELEKQAKGISGDEEIIVPPEEEPYNPDPGPQPPYNPDPGPQPVSWSSGIASAYGGSSDPSTGPYAITATGEVCDDNSTGVAVPMSWPGYRNYFHHTVQICWNGHTVVARINDCGYMGGGSRSLDLQPGIFHAFGFPTCQAWGLRQVDYLII